MARVEAVGTVADASFYLWKGMRGTSPDQVAMRSVSVVGDRRRAFIDPDLPKENIFVDTTLLPDLLQYQPYLVNPSSPKESPINVITPEGRDYATADRKDKRLVKEVSERYGAPLEVFRMGRPAWHSMPISVISMATIVAMEPHVGHDIDTRRFRMNFVLDLSHGRPFDEDKWLHKKLVTFGDPETGPQLTVVKLDERCVTVNLDPETGEEVDNLEGVIARIHSNTLGVYCNLHRAGVVHVGDTVYVSDLIR